MKKIKDRPVWRDSEAVKIVRCDYIESYRIPAVQVKPNARMWFTIYMDTKESGVASSEAS